MLFAFTCVCASLKLLRIAALPYLKVRNIYMLIELAVERLYDLTALPNTCLLNGRVFPAVAYCIGPDEPQSSDGGAAAPSDSEQCVTELSALVAQIGQIHDIQLVLLLSVDRPYPDLTRVWQFVISQRGFIRFVMISRERSPAQLLEHLSNQPAPAPSAASASTASAADAADSKSECSFSRSSCM
jgi:hypothetical protein